MIKLSHCQPYSNSNIISFFFINKSPQSVKTQIIHINKLIEKQTNGNASTVGQSELQPHYKRLSILPHEDNYFWKARKVPKNIAMGNKTSRQSASRVFTVNHQCVISMHSEPHVALCDSAGRLWCLFQTALFLSLSCNWLHFGTVRLSQSQHTHTHSAWIIECK